MSTKQALTMIIVLVAGVSSGGNHIDVIDRTRASVVGRAQLVNVAPNLEVFERVGGKRLWQHTIEVEGAAFLKPHFVGLNLRESDVLIVRSRTGHVVEEITGRGPLGAGTFWGLSARGDRLSLELHLHHDYAAAPFVIDRVIVGDEDPLAAMDHHAKSICPPADFEDAVCYQDDSAKWANASASAGVMSVGSNPNTGLWCSGVNLSGDNKVLTASHCIATQGECDDAEIVFGFSRPDCNMGTPPTDDWQSFRCGAVVVSSPYSSCEASLSALDFSLLSVLGDPASVFGAARPDPVAVDSGESVYLLQHQDGQPLEIAHGGGADVEADPPMLRYYGTLDTGPGSSGAPVFREFDDLMVAMHHCDGCETPGTGNRAVLMSEIFPLIEEHLCSTDLDLRSDGVTGLTEVAGNGNSVLEPGESWQHTPVLRNHACSESATGVTADVELDASSGGPAIVTGSDLVFGDVAAGSDAQSQTPVVVAVGPEAACGDSIVLNMTNIQTAGGGSFPDAESYLVMPIGEVVYDVLLLETFDAGIPADWTVVDGGVGGGVASTWTETNPGNRNLALTEPFVIIDSDHAGAGAVQDEQLMTPWVDCTGHEQVELSFRHDFRYYSGGGAEQGDVDVRSTASGGNWVTVATFALGSDSGQEVVDITALAQDQTDVQVRFHYHGGANDWWWAVDDVTIMGGSFVCSPAEMIFADGFESGDSSLWSTQVP